MKLDGCWFAKENTPQWPHHPSCHCILKELPYADVLSKSSVECAYSKFDPFLFDVQRKYAHGKEKLFHLWGYTVADAEWLQHEIEKQGLANYTSGEYTLGKLDNDGQRISIRVEIPRKDTAETVSFIIGWMVHPNGHIRLVTPYGGK